MAQSWAQMHTHSQYFLLVSWLCLFVFNAGRKIQDHFITLKPEKTQLPASPNTMVSLSNKKTWPCDGLSQIGLSISYDRVLAISTSVANGLKEQNNYTVLTVLQLFVKVFIQQLLLTISTITLVQQQPKTPSMGQAFLYFSLGTVKPQAKVT